MSVKLKFLKVSWQLNNRLSKPLNLFRGGRDGLKSGKYYYSGVKTFANL